MINQTPGNGMRREELLAFSQSAAHDNPEPHPSDSPLSTARDPVSGAPLRDDLEEKLEEDEGDEEGEEDGEDDFEDHQPPQSKHFQFDEVKTEQQQQQQQREKQQLHGGVDLDEVTAIRATAQAQIERFAPLPSPRLSSSCLVSHLASLVVCWTDIWKKDRKRIGIRSEIKLEPAFPSSRNRNLLPLFLLLRLP
jgi:hypothetical protein